MKFINDENVGKHIKIIEESLVDIEKGDSPGYMPTMTVKTTVHYLLKITLYLLIKELNDVSKAVNKNEDIL